ncbi:hypothetical protein KXD40_005625 [Peronospora effusa]|uniref:Uncharacterized protein n=1 Tax=Peronospora effusa TaxID=542832 RepID=A0A3M6VFB7_9STRA|nr:hypothetical protein DD238_004242 [Peronospora effusa]RQM13954.1 hypothetical protein DD237_004706 [Peronospora effusa]UIZ27364.1 hypothetical protein KXD40_005625 [Peronospora effusa]
MSSVDVVNFTGDANTTRENVHMLKDAADIRLDGRRVSFGRNVVNHHSNGSSFFVMHDDNEHLYEIGMDAH